MKGKFALVLMGLFVFSVLLILGSISVSAGVAGEDWGAGNAQGYVVVGDVEEIDCRWEGDLIYSYVTIFVVDVERGPEDLRSQEIVVKHLGGGIDGLVMWQSDQAYFAVGETVRVHLQEELQWFAVIGGSMGKVSLDSELRPVDQYVVEGYLFQWYKPSVGWQSSKTSPGAGWYGPLHWFDADIPVQWYIDQTTSYPGISWSDFRTYVQRAYDAWEDEPTSTIDFTYMGYTSGKTWGEDDGYNIFCWRYIDGSGSVLGVTRSWAKTVGSDQLQMLDSDVELDTGDPWSAADVASADKFDVQNVGTHENGHVCGLADLYDPGDSEQTMYGYSSKGETKKRTLADGDVAGIYTLYPGCFIATAAYGSELAPEVQFLRGFRNQIAVETFVGAEGVALFNQIYFSFSPNVAQFIRAHPTIRAVVKTLLYPLVGIVHLSAATYSLFAFNPELGVTAAALLGGSLIGAIYLAPLAMLIITLVKRWTKKTLRIASLKLFATLWLVGIALVGLVGMTLSESLMMIAVALLVLTATVASAAGTGLVIVKGIRLLRKRFRFEIHQYVNRARSSLADC